MKRVVFCLLLVLLGGTHSVQATTSQVYQFDDYEIRMMRSSVDGNRGYELEKIGRNPFSRMLYYPDTSIHVNDIVEIDGNHVLFGYLHEEGNATYYDGFLTVLSPSGEELYRRTFDYNQDEDVLDVIDMGEVVFAVVRLVTMNDREQYDFLRMQIVSLSHSYDTLDAIELYQDPVSMMAKDGLLLLNFDYDSSYDMGITKTMDIHGQGDPLPIEPGRVYENEIDIPFLNQAILNGTPVEHGITLSYPGHYELLYDDFSYEFTVSTTVRGVEDGGVYNEPVIPIVGAGQVYLNQDLYSSGTPITEPGQYDLVIQGLNGYRETISFTLTSNLSGVYHNGHYDSAVELSFEGTGYLNNGYISSPYQVEQPGEYILKIEGENDYLETYFFTIEEPVERYTMLDFLRQFDLAILGVTLISGFLVLKKK